MTNALATKTIIDSETGEEFDIAPEKTQKAETIIYKIKHDLIDICTNLKELKEERLYLHALREDGDIGYESFSDFCIERLPWGYRQVQKYISIADSFLKDSNYQEEIFQLPFNSLYQLSQLAPETQAEMLESGTLVLSTGEEFDIESLTKVKTKELEKKLRSEKLKYSKLNTEHQEMEDEYNTEINELKREVKQLNDMIDIPEEDRKYHKKITKLRESRTKVNEAFAMMQAAFMTLHQIDLSDENQSVVSDIEGFMVTTASRLMQLQDDYGASLGYYRESLQIMAAEK